jgi:hypothetical protein
VPLYGWLEIWMIALKKITRLLYRHSKKRLKNILNLAVLMATQIDYWKTKNKKNAGYTIMAFMVNSIMLKSHGPLQACGLKWSGCASWPITAHVQS